MIIEAPLRDDPRYVYPNVSLPGGKVGFNEAFISTAAAEYYEETLQHITLNMSLSCRHFTHKPTAPKPFVSHVFVAKIPTSQLTDETEKVRLCLCLCLCFVERFRVVFVRECAMFLCVCGICTLKLLTVHSLCAPLHPARALCLRLSVARCTTIMPSKNYSKLSHVSFFWCKLFKTQKMSNIKVSALNKLQLLLCANVFCTGGCIPTHIST